MKVILFLFGEGKDLNILQMCDRAIVIFLLTLLMIRIAGMRTFGKRSAVDNVVLIILGAVISRAIVGASDFWPVVCASLALVLVHRLFSWLTVYNDTIGHLVKGESICLYKNGQVLSDNMSKAMISRKDMMEGVRLMLNEANLDHVEEIHLERNGQISVVKKKQAGN